MAEPLASQTTPMISVDDDERAVTFYKRLGFRSIAEIKRPGGGLERAVLQIGAIFFMLCLLILFLRKVNAAI
jgi:hypothetical protein